MNSSPVAIGFSLWLQPTGQVFDRLADIIKQLSTQYRAPVFEPHVTLLGDLIGDEREITNQARQLAAHIRPFPVTLTSIDCLDVYFRCLFLRASETPALLEANRVARWTWHREQDPKFMPHLSLLYGTFDVETKKRIIATIGRDFDESFRVDQIHLLSCSGEPREWYKIKTFDLGMT